MRYFLDTEFIEYPCTIDLISIGIVAEDGRTFYAESTEVDWSKASPWVTEFVRPHLMFDYDDHHLHYLETTDGCIEMAAPRQDIGRAIVDHFVEDADPEFWAYYADYDWVVFCWLFGSMIDHPKDFPMLCLDLKQWAKDLGSPNLPVQGGTEHNALNDAFWNREVWAFLAEEAK